MRFIQGLRTLLTKSWYNYSFILSLIATGIISLWILTIGSLTPNIDDPIQGIGISVVVSFQYFVFTLIILSLIPKGRKMFFETGQAIRNQVLLSIVFVIVFMILGGLSAFVGPAVGAALAFGDATITAYFAVLLGWNMGKSVGSKIGNRKATQWIVFALFLLVDVLAFGAAWMILGLDTLPFEQQIMMLMFPLEVLLLPVLTIALRNRQSHPEQTTLMASVLFVLGIYHTSRLVSIVDAQWTLVDIAIQLVLLIYGLSTTVAKMEEGSNLPPRISIAVILLVILSRVGSQVNRLLAAASGFGPIVQEGIVSFTILNLAILGLIVPVYWLWQKRKSEPASVE